MGLGMRVTEMKRKMKNCCRSLGIFPPICVFLADLLMSHHLSRKDLKRLCDYSCAGRMSDADSSMPLYMLLPNRQQCRS